MQTNKTWRRGALSVLAAAAVAVGAFGASAPATADPVGTPTFRTLAGVGSDTTQDLNNGLASTITIGGSLVLGSYDATGSSTIKTKSTGTTFTRPNGSSQGVTALKSAKGTTLWNGQDLASTDLQFARSSSAATFVSGGTYSYIPLALDAVTYASASTTTVPTNLTKAQLTAIYSASNGSSVTINGTNYVVGTQANAAAQIRPFLPQSGSGTRSFWLAQLGLTEALIGSAVSSSYSGGSVQEHDGSVIAAVPNAIVPFSIAQHIAQGRSATLAANYDITVADRRHGAVLRQVAGVNPLTAGGALNTAFPIARPVFTVVQFSELSTNSTLRAVFATEDGLAYTATRPGTVNQLVITDFGFGDLTGGVTIGGVTYNPGDTTSFRAN